MFYKRFSFQVVVRIILITVCCLLLPFIAKTEGYVVVTINLVLLIILQTWLLIAYVGRIRKNLYNFLSSFKGGEPTQVYSKKGKKKVDEDLEDIYNIINEAFKNTRIDKEQQYQYLQYVVEHVGSGLIAFNQEGKVELFNEAAKELLKIPILSNVRDLNKIDSRFYEFISGLKPNQQKLLKIQIEGEDIYLLIRATIFKILEKKMWLVSMYNIRASLEKKELESWQNLIQVLTHEITNSISPITSLSSTIARYFRKGNTMEPVSTDEINKNTLIKTLEGLDTIDQRGKGLVNFINNYRSYSKLPTPILKKFSIAEIFQSTKLLFMEKLDFGNIILTENIKPQDLTLRADRKLIEQILINLVNNSMYAFERFDSGQKEISLVGRKNNEGCIEILVVDNGPGIADDVKEKVFVPFFTTRKNGSGIGLSLSRQFMQLHGGTISLYSVPGKETTFTLRF